MRIALALLAAFIAGVPAPAHAAELGRLFHTPEQRNALDAWRKGRPGQQPQQAPDPGPAAVQSRSARIDGYVLRSDGRSTIWVDGNAAEGANAGLRPQIRRDAPGRVSVTAPGGERRVETQVGGSFDAASGTARDVIGEGEIKVKR